MVQQVQTKDEEAQAAFEQYRASLRPEALQIPEELEAGAPVPPSWASTPEEWEKVCRRAVDAFREKPAYDFADAVAVRGYYPDELGDRPTAARGADQRDDGEGNSASGALDTAKYRG